MKRMERRLAALEQHPRPACSQYANWLPTVVVEGMDAPLPWLLLAVKWMLAPRQAARVLVLVDHAANNY